MTIASVMTDAPPSIYHTGPVDVLTFVPGSLEAKEIVRLSQLAEYRIIPSRNAQSVPSPESVQGTEDTIADLRKITALARLVCGVDIAMVNIIDADYQYMLAAEGIAADRCSRQDSMCAVILREGPSAVVVPDAREDPRFAGSPFVTGVIDVLRFYASVPLSTPDGHVIGRLCVADRDAHQLSTQQIAGLEALAAQTMQTLKLHHRTRLLVEAVTQLTGSNTTLAEFAARASHDLQAPLSSIVAYAEVLGDHPVLAQDPQAAGFVQRIEAAGQRMSTMIVELLAYAQAGTQLSMRPVDLRPLMGELLEDLQEQIRASQARIDVDVDVVSGDDSQLRAMLQNLLTNAMKYRRSDVPCHIRVVSHASADKWRLVISDNGKGIPLSERERIFEPLTRLDRDQAIAGTGIGLATVQRIAQAHGGRLSITETPGGGTTMTLHVPAID